jgi:predicted GNAT superfamily acetyltransferase
LTDEITIRRFSTTAEYQECVVLQEDTWGVGFSERVSPAILLISQILGGVAAGAYDDDGRLVGFVYGMTGVRDGEVVHWSDMLAVRPEIRDAGLGRRLKAYQRDELVRDGIGKMYWTFDPLRSRNAHLNVSKLGIVIREYEVDMYGESDSPLHSGIGTDRFIALWLLSSERVRSRLAGEAEGAPPPALSAGAALDAEIGGGHPKPGVPDLSLGNDTVSVVIPSDIAAVMEADMELAWAWRAATRTAFTHYLAAGFEVREFVRGTTVSEYYLMRRSDDDS